MKMTYGSIIRKETRPFYLALNTILAYEYEYNGGIRIIIIISDEYKQKVNKWCLYQGVFVLHVFFYYKLHFGSRMCNFNPTSRSPLLGFDHKAATHLIPYSMSYTQLIAVMVGSDTKCYKLMGRTHP